MAESEVAPPNKAVKFRGKPKIETARLPRMGVKAPSLRKRAKKLRSRGMISDKAMKRHMGED